MTARLVALVAALVLAGCDDTAAYLSHRGGVYECQATRVDVVELCTELAREDLELATGWRCWPTTRLWPRLTGCIYRCTGERGCNARTGCFCPEE